MNPEDICDDIIEAMKVIKAERVVDGLVQLYHVPGENKQKASSHTAMIKGLRKTLKTQNDPMAEKKFKQDMVAMAKPYSGRSRQSSGTLNLSKQGEEMY
jgi:hypothetical protein